MRVPQPAEPHTQPPSGPPDEGPTISVSALARKLGVAPSTLRTWDRRYGIGPSVHAQGSHRRYTPRDVARLECMQHALDGGANSAEAARYAINAMATYSSESDHRPRVKNLGDNSVNGTETDPSNLLSSFSGLGGGEASVRNLSGALLARDVVTIRRIVVRAVAERGFSSTWTTLVVPVLEWADEGRNSEAAAASVRVFAECVAGILSTMTLDAPIGGGGRVLLVHVPANPPDTVPADPYGLEFRALGAALATASVDTRIALPLCRSALLAAVTNAEPDAIVLWLPAAGCDLPSLLRAIRRRRTGLTMLAGGPGCRTQSLPRSIAVLGTLDEAVDAVTAVTRPRGGRTMR
ncbi:transcriptional regulator [Rhodococcus opacus]|uniref:Transcriptional regulator n=1 Tax=Rhodococcus opacus TaxID=37919 RepID=A0A2S8JI49_RHOOP|nr:transcriptional regulator [Rhodococcus opacus]